MLVLTVPDGASGSRVDLLCANTTPVAVQIGSGGNANVAAVVSVIGTNLSAPIVMQLVPAGHAPGFYLITLDVVNQVAPLTGTIARTIAYSAPNFGATTASGAAVAITQTGHAAGTSFPGLGLMSDGVAPIVLTLTPAAITGAPVTHVYAAAMLVGS